MIRKGQTWVDKKRRPTSSFTVLRIYTRTYPDGNTAERVKGALVCGEDAQGMHLRDLDSRSLAKMFPHLLFNPEVGPPEMDQ